MRDRIQRAADEAAAEERARLEAELSLAEQERARLKGELAALSKEWDRLAEEWAKISDEWDIIAAENARLPEYEGELRRLREENARLRAELAKKRF